MSSKVALVLALLMAAPAVADFALEREVVISNQEAEEYRPRIAYNSARDEYLVVWSDSWELVVHPAPFRGIMARRYDRYGVAIGGAYAITPTDDFHDRQHPDVVYDAIADRYLVVYTYNSETGSSAVEPNDWDIRAIRLGSTGAPISAEFTVAATIDDELEPRVAVSWPFGEAPKYMVVWSQQPATGRKVVRGALFPWGTPPSSFLVASAEFDHRIEPGVAYSYFYNNFLVVYAGVGATIAGDIFATTVSHSGVVGSEIVVAGWPDVETNPSVAGCGWKNFLITWESQVGATDSDIYARRLRGDGLVLDAPTHVSAWAFLERNAAVSCMPDNVIGGTDEYLVAFELQYSNTSGPFGITGLIIDDSGGVRGPAFTIRTVYIGEAGVAFHPAVCGGAAGWFTAWEHQRQEASAYLDIRGRSVWQLFADGFEFGDYFSWSSWTP